jgi:hypothetical protein
LRFHEFGGTDISMMERMPVPMFTDLILKQNDIKKKEREMMEELKNNQANSRKNKIRRRG